MADLHATAPLGDIRKFDAGSGVQLTVRSNFAMVQLFAKTGKAGDLARKMGIVSGPGKAHVAKSFTAFPLSPGQWILVSEGSRENTFGWEISKKIAGIGHVSEQGDARVCIRVSGPNSRDLMSRGCRLDLHQSVAAQDFCAQTQMAQIGVLIHQISDEPAYDLYVYAGFARSFWHWLTETAAQF
jgi:methylglutamate dehydrogenase subunit D